MFKCRKCESENLFTKESGNNIGLYCSDCGAWQKWLGKDELRVFEHSKEENINSKREKLLTIIDNWYYDNDCENCVNYRLNCRRCRNDINFSPSDKYFEKLADEIMKWSKE